VCWNGCWQKSVWSRAGAEKFAEREHVYSADAELAHRARAPASIFQTTTEGFNFHLTGRQ
jgi:hypothetical protein